MNAIGAQFFAGLNNAAPTAEQMSEYAEQQRPVREDAVASIVELNEPKSLEAGVKKFEAAVNADLDAVQADPSVAFAGDAFKTSHKVAKKIGLKACAGGRS
ncbi:MAG: hypothetical protein MUP67_15000 [Acidimicrobiia bacterium]|nr:hypothetical protein [Acidimicrobiia bacterium]